MAANHNFPMNLNRCFLLALMLLTTRGMASTINWSSQINAGLFTSAGQPLDTSFSFEIGTFLAGFVPTYHNTNQWEANWLAFDRAFDPTLGDPNDGDPEGWNIPDQFYVGAAEHIAPLGSSDSFYATPGAVFAQNSAAYLWVYNDKNIVPGSEWALVTYINSLGNTGNDWLCPDPNDPPGTSYEWKLEDADLAIVGGGNGSRGDGDYSVDPGIFNIQTIAVPEPGSALLIGLAAGVLGTRRNRKNKKAQG